MVSKEAGKCVLTNSESDSETAPSLALEVKRSSDPSRHARKQKNKALQVRFKDICEAQNEQAAAAAAAAAKGGKPVSYKVAYRKYMTVPARRSIPNVTKSTGVQTSPDLKKRYQTFPFERKKGHSVKHAAAAEGFKGQDNGFVIDVKRAKAGEAEVGGSSGGRVEKARALLHTNECVATVEQHTQAGRACADGPGGGLCSTTLLLSCSADGPITGGDEADYRICSVRSKHRKGFHQREVDAAERALAKRQLLNSEEGVAGTLLLADATGSKVTGPIAWNSLTQVECLESPSARSKRQKALQLNGLQAQTLPRAGCTTQAQCHAGTLSARPLRAMEEATVATATGGPARGAAAAAGDSEACKQIVPVAQGGDVKAQLQAMENMISSSQETIKVLLGVIQELEKGEAHREGVELDFKQQEDKLQPLMKRLCPTEDSHFPPLPYPQEAFTSTPKRKAKAESKKHARWKLWFL